MKEYLEKMIAAMRPAFSREAAFIWFAVAFAGFIARTDNYGVSSIIRALWLIMHKAVHTIDQRIVFNGDHTKVVKDGRKMPEIETLHQDSETGSKPSFFRGHHWACISLLIRAKEKCFGAPMWAEIHRESLGEKRTTRMVNQAGKIAESLGFGAYLVLDAYFAVGPVFIAAKHYGGRLLILTRAKKNAVAYLDPRPRPEKSPRGRPPKYGEKLKLMELFDAWSEKFETAEALVYDKAENVRCLVLDLI